MILSMTGVGKATTRYADKSITVFIKTLNGKQLDISTRLPLLYRERELELRNLVSEALVRGKVELSITIDDHSTALSGVQQINREAIRYYIDALDAVAREEAGRSAYIEQNIELQKLLKLPGVLVSLDQTQQELNDEEWAALTEAMTLALGEVRAFRLQEGEMLRGVLTERIENIRALLSEVANPEAERILAVRTRLEEGLKKIALEGYDRSRLEQEMVYYIEKLDINEEKDRLSHHLSYFLQELDKPEAGQGRKLGFIAQEIGREINTLGSKSNHAEMQQIVVKMKDELEQIKEQVLNVL